MRNEFIYFKQLFPLMEQYGFRVEERQARRWLKHLDLEPNLSVWDALAFAHFCGWRYQNPTAKLRDYQKVQFGLPSNWDDLALMLNMSRATVCRWSKKYNIGFPFRESELMQWFKLRWSLDKDSVL